MVGVEIAPGRTTTARVCPTRPRRARTVRSAATGAGPALSSAHDARFNRGRIQPHRPADPPRQRHRDLIDPHRQPRPVPHHRARADRQKVIAAPHRASPPLGHRPALAGPYSATFSAQWLHRVAAAAPPRPGIIGRKHAANERDQRDPERGRRRSAHRHTTIHNRRAAASGRNQVPQQARRCQPARQHRHRHARSRMNAAPRQIKVRHRAARPRPPERRHRSVHRLPVTARPPSPGTISRTASASSLLSPRFAGAPSGRTVAAGRTSASRIGRSPLG